MQSVPDRLNRFLKVHIKKKLNCYLLRVVKKREKKEKASLAKTHFVYCDYAKLSDICLN
jgi:hypothetical protein